MNVPMNVRKLFLIQGFTLLLVFTFSGCDRVYRLLHKEGAEEKQVLGEINVNEPNPNVIKIQKLLKLYGYRIGKVDGILGGFTRNAIGDFQKDQGIKVSRFVDKATWEQLQLFERPGLVKEGELNKLAVQAALKEAGFNPGSLDGKFGPQTQKAIQQFQKAKGLKSDGKVGYKTLTKLAEYLPVITPGAAP